MINRLIARFVSLLPENLVWIFSQRYIAGKRLEEAVAVVQNLNSQGIKATIDVLGEYIKEKQEAIEYKNKYLEAIDVIIENNLETTFSVKPSMFGLLLDEEFCYVQLKEVIAKANKAQVSVCMDMEDSGCTDVEIDIFERLYKEYPGTITIVLQAYLKRTLDDLKRLKSFMIPGYPINVRICKGIYVEPSKVAYKNYHEINKNYLKCLDFLLDNKFFAAIATHDKNLIPQIEGILSSKGIPKSGYEFQMLYGVRPQYSQKLLDSGHTMRVYVPFGTHWYGYSTRRLKENPRMVSHILKALIVRG